MIISKYRLLPMFLLLLLSCGPNESGPDMNMPDMSDMDMDLDPEMDPSWVQLKTDWPAGLLSVHGTSAEDVWVVGARTHGRAAAFHYDGVSWNALEIPPEVDLWWVHATTQEVFFGGSDATVLRYRSGELERMDTPGLARHTVFGVWGTGNDLYAVGGIGNRNGFVWHFDGNAWRSLPLPADTPLLPSGGMAGIFKVWGDGEGTVWFVGAAGLVLKRTEDGPLIRVPVPTSEILFTVHGNSERVLAVGGVSRGLVVQISPSVEVLSPQPSQLLQGLHVGSPGIWASGAGGVLWQLQEDVWKNHGAGPGVPVESYHAVWEDPEGGIWAVGGSVLSPALDRGVIVYQGDRPISFELSPPDPPQISLECPEELIKRGSERSVARRWIEQNLAAIRLEIPRPGVHARNLFHLSVTLFDAWASFEESQDGVMFQEPATGLEITDREAVMSYAAFHVLSHRYGNARGGDRHNACFRAVMTDMGLDPDRVGDNGTSAALGNRIGAHIVASFMEDGALEAQDYTDQDYVAPSPPLFVDEPGTRAMNPTLWQPLNLARAVTQNGIALESGPIAYIGPHWGEVTPFSLARSVPGEPYIEPGPFPALGEEMRDWVVDVIARTSQLATSNVSIDISPGSYGNQPLGSDESPGHELNPVTGLPYVPQLVPHRDFARVLAEYWADGPDSETPPGHWNTIAHLAVDHAEFDNRLFGGEQSDPLTYDVHLYLILNGALHDAAIVAWELKRLYETARPITLIRWMGGRGQSSDPTGIAYNPDGLPLITNLIELITEESSAPGARHELLAPYVGQIALLTWPGAPGDPEAQVSAPAWIRAVDWIPFQPATFVSPAFPGYVSGHSTFSRAAAEVLAELTGTPYFPGGLGEFVASENRYLTFEDGPSTEVRLQWATYFDAANQSGQSRIYGGIHILPDDMDGRRFGASVGQSALDWARANLQATP